MQTGLPVVAGAINHEGLTTFQASAASGRPGQARQPSVEDRAVQCVSVCLPLMQELRYQLPLFNTLETTAHRASVPGHGCLLSLEHCVRATWLV